MAFIQIPFRFHSRVAMVVVEIGNKNNPSRGGVRLYSKPIKAATFSSGYKRQKVAAARRMIVVRRVR